MKAKYDLIIFGASGFTGKLISNYIASHKNTSDLKWAIAGRNKKKINKKGNKANNQNKIKLY